MRMFRTYEADRVEKYLIMEDSLMKAEKRFGNFSQNFIKNREIFSNLNRVYQDIKNHDRIWCIFTNLFNIKTSEHRSSEIKGMESRQILSHQFLARSTWLVLLGRRQRFFLPLLILTIILLTLFFTWIWFILLLLILIFYSFFVMIWMYWFFLALLLGIIFILWSFLAWLFLAVLFLPRGSGWSYSLILLIFTLWYVLYYLFGLRPTIRILRKKNMLIFLFFFDQLPQWFYLGSFSQNLLLGN